MKWPSPVFTKNKAAASAILPGLFFPWCLKKPWFCSIPLCLLSPKKFFQILPATSGSVMKASFPYDPETYKTRRDETEENRMGFIFDLISGIRNIRSEMNIQPSMKIKVLVHTEEEPEKLLIAENKSVIANLATLESLFFCDADSLPHSAATSVTGNTTCYVSLEGVIDFDKEIKTAGKGA